MPTEFIKGSKSYAGGRIRKTTAGKWCAQVVLEEKTRRWFFDTEKEAKEKLSTEQPKRRKQGVTAVALTNRQTLDALDALAKVKEAGETATFKEMAEFWLKHNARTDKDAPLSELYARYLKELEAPHDGGDAVRPATLATKKKRLKSFIELYGKSPVRKLTEPDVKAWTDAYSHLAPRSILNQKIELQAFLNWCQEDSKGRFENEICKVKQRKRKGSGAAAAILTPEQTRVILHDLEADKPPRYAVAFALLSFAGIRPEELFRRDCPLTWDAVRLSEKRIHIQVENSKTADYRKIDIEPNLAAWLERYGKKTGRIAPEEKKFRYARKKAMEKAGLERWPPDACRHSYATYGTEIHGIHKTAENMGHIGGVRMLKKHYEGRATHEAALEYFAIMPAGDARAVIPFQEATA
jgi:integrase